MIKMREGRRKRAGKGAAGEARVLKTALIVKNRLKKEEVLKEKEDAKQVREKVRIAQAEWKQAKEEGFPRDIRVFR